MSVKCEVIKKIPKLLSEEMVNVNSVVYSPNKRRSDVSKQKLVGQIKLLHENNKRLAKHLAKMVSQACKLEDKKVLYESLKLESKICAKNIQTYISNVETHLQRILSEISGWLSAFSQIQNLTNDAKDKVVLFMNHLESTNDKESKDEFYPDALKVSSQNNINLLETVIEDVETPSTVYLRRKRSLTNFKKSASKAKSSPNSKSSLTNKYTLTSGAASTRAQNSISKHSTQDREFDTSKDTESKKEICGKIKYETLEEMPPLEDSKEKSCSKDVLDDSRKLRPRKPVNYSLNRTSSNTLPKTRNLTQLRIKENTADSKKPNDQSAAGAKPTSTRVKKPHLPRIVKKETLTQQDPQGSKNHYAELFQNHSKGTSRHSLARADFRHLSDVTSKAQTSKTHQFSDYVPTPKSTTEKDERFIRENERRRPNYKTCSKAIKDFPVDPCVTDNFPLVIKKEMEESPEESFLNIQYSSHLTSAKAADSLSYYAAWLRDLG